MAKTDDKKKPEAREMEIVNEGDAAAFQRALDAMIVSADSLSAEGFQFEKFVSLKEGQGIGGRFLGIGGVVITGFPQPGKPAEPTRLPTVGVLVTIKDPETGKVAGEVVARMIATSAIYSQVQRIPVGDDVTILCQPGKEKTRGGFMVSRFLVGNRPNTNPVRPVEGFYPPRVAVTALALASKPATLNDEPIPSDAVALAVAQIEAAKVKALPEGDAAPALPAKPEGGASAEQ